MSAQLIALGVFIAVFALSAARNVNIGIVMFPAACGVGLWVADMALKDVVAEFPLSILVLLVGVTYFFGVAHANGTVDWLIESSLARVGGRDKLFPAAFFVLTAGLSAMGAPLGGLVMAPMGMSIAHRRGIDPMLMALSMGAGLSAGAFAPTSLFGIITWGTADAAGITLSPLLLFGVAVAVNVVLVAVAYALFGRSRVERRTPAFAEAMVARGAALSESGQSTLTVDDDGPAAEPARPGRPTPIQTLTIVAMAGLVGTVIALSVSGLEPDIGVLGFALGAVLALVDPAAGKQAMTRIDWGSVLLVGGIITFVGVLTELGVVDMLGRQAVHLGSPLVAALLLCAAAALISAFASTTGMLAALVPLALPLIADGGIPGWALICAIGVCSSIVDVSPFSTVGATYVATTVDEAERPRMTRMLTRWGLSMVVVGPIALTLTLIVPGMVFS
ncbi:MULTISPECIES: SLC13 family permease [Tsukamurella]|uniref:C4-dicarboxylate ABC transporter n=2 Tax=Tsukamurella TaxID=2060 RepID=A0A5C5RXL9_9ACTN|nr:MULTISPECIES: SLC13 family permease [Tsukamurella]NMD58220.1 C4-dicarboxylate ABC transporter [Tsukamurella columbiensis]TWS26975.1 C4-dicarboxylate ABC transporter [Tsukamurella conjunctivitidis]